MTTTVHKIEDSIKEAKVHVDLAAALQRLASNKDFKAVILTGYLKDEAIRLVHLKAHPAMSAANHQSSIVSQIDAIGGLLSYFRTLEHNASIARKSIEADEETRDELLASELQA